jgi:hypothetical protein
MNSRLFTLAGSLLFLSTFVFIPSSRAQSSTQQPAPAPASAPSTHPPAKDPKAPANATANSPAKPPAKKVWTDDDMGSLSGPNYKEDSGAASGGSSYYPRSTSGAPNADYYRNQISQLQKKIADIDAKIDNYQALSHGEAPGQAQKMYGERLPDSRGDIQALVDQKKALQKQIDDLQDQARHAGVEPGQLR